MSGYANMNENNLYYNNQDQQPQSFQQMYDTEYNLLQSQPLDFQSFKEVNSEYPNYYKPYDNSGVNNYAEQSAAMQNSLYPDVLMASSQNFEQDEFEDTEPPLLEELEIYPERILEKMIIALFPLKQTQFAIESDFLTKGTDLAGPLTFCIILAINLFISGSKIYFGYIYGLSVMSCLMMYCLLSLMTSNDVFTLANVTSILGYSLLPIVGLSVLGVFMGLHGYNGIIISAIAVIWSSFSASRLFIAISGEADQRPLIAYPCALVCGVFALLVVF